MLHLFFSQKPETLGALPHNPPGSGMIPLLPRLKKQILAFAEHIMFMFPFAESWIWFCISGRGGAPPI